MTWLAGGVATGKRHSGIPCDHKVTDETQVQEFWKRHESQPSLPDRQKPLCASLRLMRRLRLSLSGAKFGCVAALNHEQDVPGPLSTPLKRGLGKGSAHSQGVCRCGVPAADLCYQARPVGGTSVSPACEVSSPLSTH